MAKWLMLAGCLYDMISPGLIVADIYVAMGADIKSYNMGLVKDNLLIWYLLFTQIVWLDVSLVL